MKAMNKKILILLAAACLTAGCGSSEEASEAQAAIQPEWMLVARDTELCEYGNGAEAFLFYGPDSVYLLNGALVMEISVSNQSLHPMKAEPLLEDICLNGKPAAFTVQTDDTAEEEQTLLPVQTAVTTVTISTSLSADEITSVSGSITLFDAGGTAFGDAQSFEVPLTRWEGNS